MTTDKREPLDVGHLKVDEQDKARKHTAWPDQEKKGDHDYAREQIREAGEGSLAGTGTSEVLDEFKKSVEFEK